MAPKATGTALSPRERTESDGTPARKPSKIKKESPAQSRSPSKQENTDATQICGEEELQRDKAELPGEYNEAQCQMKKSKRPAQRRRKKHVDSAADIVEDQQIPLWIADHATSEHHAPLENVIKVFTTHAAPRFASPWKTSSQWSSVGSAFAIENNRVLTNAHVVASSHLIHVRRSDGHRKFIARVEAMCFECDLAVLNVADAEFWNGLQSFSLAGHLPALQDTVTVIGFPDSPCGGDSVCVTQGVVSRMDLHHYTLDSQLLVVQIDAAINPGNSGGPCVDEDGLLVGVAFQKGANSGQDNIGYIIPTPVVQIFLHCFENQTWGFGKSGVTCSLLDNPSLRDAVGVPEGVSGVLVTSVEPTAPAHGLFALAEDVILKVDGHEVGHDGTVSLTDLHQIGEPTRSLRLRIQFEWLFRMRLPGDVVELEVFRKGVRRQISMPLCRGLKLVCSDPLWSERLGTQPEYLLVGGLVFVPLTEPFLSELFEGSWDLCPYRLNYLWKHGKAESESQQVVVLGDVLACEFTQGYEAHIYLPIERCDGQTINNLSHLSALVAGCTEAFLRFDLAEGQLLALRRDEIETATQAVMESNQIAAAQHIIDRSKCVKLPGQLLGPRGTGTT